MDGHGAVPDKCDFLERNDNHILAAENPTDIMKKKTKMDTEKVTRSVGAQTSFARVNSEITQRE